MFWGESVKFWLSLNLFLKEPAGRFQTALAGKGLCIRDFTAKENQTHFSLGKMAHQGKWRCENQTPRNSW